MLEGVTVAICCHNSENEIESTLRYLSRQEVHEEILWEVLLVDNASVDNTVKLAEQTWADCGAPVPFRVVEELKLGVTHARKTSVFQSTYAYILMVDDDVWLSPNYVNDGFYIMQKYPIVGVLCGWGDPVFEINPFRIG